MPAYQGTRITNDMSDMIPLHTKLSLLLEGSGFTTVPQTILWTIKVN